SAVKWMRQTAQVDPEKEISEAFYPKAFVDLFRQVRAEVRAKGLPAGEAGGIVQPEKAAAEPPPAREASVRAADPIETPKLQAKPLRAETEGEAKPKASLGSLFTEGHWEVNIHGGIWTIDPFMSMFEERLLDKLDEELQNEMVKNLGQSYAGLVKSVYTPALELDSQGGNYGFELRYFARGWAGTFSIGVSLEKTRIKLLMTGSATQTFTNGGTAEAEATASLETSPLSTNFGFRWELGRGRLRPFVSLGFGFASFSGTAAYSYSGTFQLGSIQDTIGEDDTLTFEELSENIDFAIPENILIFQLGLGLKLDVTKRVALLAEAGIWDGLFLRGGLAYRF
ncbi:MAG: hypothetical protein PHI34_11395, partial [Acidobacteriota bacterium]|nr:hypothetical protein [Acidobacteriota bacterium]